MLIGRLAHVACGTEGDAEETAAFYRELFGVVEVARDSSTTYLSGGMHPGFDLALGPWPRGLHHFAFEVGGPRDLEEAAERLTGAGVEVRELAAGEEYGVAGGIRFVLPSGHLVELVLPERTAVFQPIPTADPRHRIGVGPVALEHITLNLDDVEETASFLVEHLDFKITELARPVGQPWFNAFLRTRDIHHDLGLFRNHEGEGPGLDHYGFAVGAVDDLVRVADIARGLGLMLECSPGRHLAGNNVFVYLGDPSRNRVEVATPLATIAVGAEPRIFEAKNDGEWRGIFDAWREGIPPAVRTPNPCFDGRRREAGESARG